MINYFLNLPSYLLRKFRSRKISFSLTSIDLLISYIFKNQKKGFYIDVGCNHPVYNNNTYLLYKKGWRGINIDLDKKSIDLFNIFRKHDYNQNTAISSSFEDAELFFYHDKSPINTINKKSAEFQKAKPREIKKIKTQTLDSIIEKSPFNNKKIDLISIDVEGHELHVLKGLNLKKYSPKIVIIEYLDLSLKKLEIINFNFDKIFSSSVYKYMTDNGYTLVNWLHSDLVFVNNGLRD
ncbi:FkbM family methyltransferase [Pelagibacteraceae bacterium]|nr:FkbM family methyltransferase [Pelagibacteraceae bacterium]